MSKTILIVESDPALSERMSTELKSKGFAVQSTTDGKGSVELIRRNRPDLVVMAVDLSAGQNGYILCGKLKKDDELKAIPIVIVGNPDGFAQHKKLKTRADDYVAKPLDLAALTEAAGNLVGFPEVASDEVVEEDGLSLSELVDEGDPQTGEFAAEEIAVDTDDETVGGDPELDMLDAAFESATDAPPPGQPAEDEGFGALDALGGDTDRFGDGASDEVPLDVNTSDIAVDGVDSLEEEDADHGGDRTVVGFMPPDLLPPPRPAARTVTPAPGTDLGELRALREKVAELEGALSDANERAEEAQGRTRELEDQVGTLSSDLEAARASSAGTSSKEVFALREAANKKDKEILRLKTEINHKDNEVVELQDKVLQLEQQMSESSGETAKKDAQIRTLSQKAEQLAAERKRFDQQLLHAKEEARTASARLTTVQGDLDEARGQLGGAQAELDELRTRTGDLESQLRQARDEGDELRGEVENLRLSSEGARHEADELRSQLEQAQMDLDAAKNQLTAQATAFAEEASGLRRRVGELEEQAQKHEDRLTKFYSKIKDDEKIREKTRKAIAIALQLMDEQRVELDVDEAMEVEG